MASSGCSRGFVGLRVEKKVVSLDCFSGERDINRKREKKNIEDKKRILK